MDVVRFLSVSCLLALLGIAGCSSDVHERIDLLQNDLNILSSKLENDKAAIINNQKKQKHALKRELRKEMKKRVKDALDEILSGEMYRDIIRSKVAAEVKHMRRSHLQMKQRKHQMTSLLNQMQTSLDVVQEENRKFRKDLKETTCQCNTGKASKPTQTSNYSSIIATKTSSYPLTSTVPSTTTTGPRPTTPAPEDRNHIFVLPYQISSKHHPRLVNIHSNAVSIYLYLNLKDVQSVAYISKLNSLFIGLSNPNKIISSELNSSSVKTIKHNVLTLGMAVDNKISTVFLSTTRPFYTISRMGLDGGEFSTVVSLSGYSYSPRAIAVDINTEIIYTCNVRYLLSVRYNGSGLTTLDTGASIYAVTLDIINGVLYYGYHFKLMKLSLNTNTSTEVTRLTEWMWNLVYYRDTVYYMTYHGILGSVDVGQKNVVNTLHTEPVSGVEDYTICLIP